MAFQSIRSAHFNVCVNLIFHQIQMNLSINQDADATLRHFQQWQRTMNPGDDSHPNHHDCAILISK